MAGKRGSNIPIRTKQFVYEAAVRFPGVDRVELATSLRDELSQKGWMTPSQQTLEKMISKARNFKEDEDGPWCLGVSSNNGIPIEANSDLLKISIQCKILGEPLAIRVAKWVAQLRTVVPFNTLLHHAQKYAIREQTCESLGLVPDIDTSDLDAQIVFMAERGIEDEDWRISHTKDYPSLT